MASVWGELKRRNVVKVAVAYAIVGWLLIEVSTTVLPLFEAPDWIAQVFAFFIIAGFPVALILSWAYEITPEGMKRSHEVPAPESITRVTGRKLDFAIIGALVLALGFVVYNYVLEDGEVAVGVLPNSVAVLPFENMSVDPKEAFYASGIHEEILNQLVKLSALNVIARTSMQQYADTDKSIPEIAEELNVETVMEGSVRYADGRIRITTQLNDGLTGAHLWSETYTRDFDDIFAIESDVAMNVANAVGAEFSLEEQASIERVPTRSAAAYALYLRALQTIERAARQALLDRAITLDPEFALAYAWKAFYYAYSLSPSDETDRTVRNNAERALTLDPTIGLAHVALGISHESRWRTSEAQRAFERAYQLSPNDLEIILQYAAFMRLTGNYTEAIRTNQKAVNLDPNTRRHYSQLGTSYTSAGDYAAAATVLRKAMELDPTIISSHTQLAMVEAAQGNDADALRELEVAEQLSPSPTRLAQMAVAYGRIDRREDAVRLFNELEVSAEEAPLNDALWTMAYIAVGDYEQARERLANAINEQVPAGAFSFAAFRIPFTNLKSNAWGDPELEKPEFRELRDRIYALD